MAEKAIPSAPRQGCQILAGGRAERYHREEALNWLGTPVGVPASVAVEISAAISAEEINGLFVVYGPCGCDPSGVERTARKSQLSRYLDPGRGASD